MKLWLKQLLIPLSLIDKLTSQSGTIIDLGCGEGVISEYLARNRSRIVYGVDLNSQKLKKINPPPNLQFIKQDILKFQPKNKVSAFILSDVLHHLDPSQQSFLLRKISQYLKPNGVIIIKEIDRRQKIRALLSRFWDFIFYPHDKISYFSGDQLIAKLKQLNFSVTQIHTNRLFPGSVNLFIARHHD